MRHELPEDVTSLVKPASVHRSLYDDPAIFALEMERIFGRAWIYVGHASQVRAAGRLSSRRASGAAAVCWSAHADGTLHVLHNQCAHRGAMVVAADQGNAGEFRCCYHGWTYHTDGRLKVGAAAQRLSARLRSRRSATRDAAGAAAGELSRLRLRELAADGPSLEDFLGPMTASFDDMVDRAPDGVIEVAGGVFKHAYNGNWKLYLENLCDAAHPIFVHQSSIEAAEQRSPTTSIPTAPARSRCGRCGRTAHPMLLGIAGRDLDLPERPQLSRRLS